MTAYYIILYYILVYLKQRGSLSGKIQSYRPRIYSITLDSVPNLKLKRHLYVT